MSIIENHIANYPKGSKDMIRAIRDIVLAVAPDAVEVISYRMPAFRKGKIFIYFEAFKNHIGIYPPIRGNTDLLAALSAYRGPKDNLRFPIDQPLPMELIEAVVRQLLEQVQE